MREASGPAGPRSSSSGPAGGPVPNGGYSGPGPRASGFPNEQAARGPAGGPPPAPADRRTGAATTIPQHWSPGEAFGLSRGALSSGLQTAARGGFMGTGFGALILGLSPSWTAGPSEDELRPSDAARVTRLQQWLDYQPPEGVAAVDYGPDGFDVRIDGGSDYVPVLGRVPPDLVGGSSDALPDIDRTVPPPPLGGTFGAQTGVYGGAALPDVPTWKQAKMIQRLHAASLNLPVKMGYNPFQNMFERRIEFVRDGNAVIVRSKPVRLTSERYVMHRRHNETKYGRRLIQTVYKVIGQTYGKYTEAMDMAEVAAWSTYARMPDGRIVPAMLVEGGNMRDVLMGFMNGRYRFDAYGFTVDYALSQAGDWAASLSDKPLDMARRKAPGWLWSGNDNPALFGDADREDYADVRISEEWAQFRDAVRSQADPARVQRVAGLWRS